MFRIIKTLMVCLLFFSVYIGSNQLGANNDVFAAAMARCCNNGFCHDAPCVSPSSLNPCSEDGEYITTCTRCMFKVTTLQSCNLYIGPWPTWCIDSNGNRMYATELE